jgi:hypothetical protein
MPIYHTLQMLKQLDGLLRRKCTGNPQILAQKLGISERFFSVHTYYL